MTFATHGGGRRDYHFLEPFMPGRVSGPDLSPKMLLQNFAAPSGPIPPPQSAEGAAVELPRISQGLLNNTFRQRAASRHEGVGGRVDLLG